MKGNPLTTSAMVGRNCRARRAAKGWTQDELARQMVNKGFGWVRATVSEIERGGRRVTVDELASLAEVFATTMSALVESRASAGPRVKVAGMENRELRDLIEFELARIDTMVPEVTQRARAALLADAVTDFLAVRVGKRLLEDRDD